MSKTLHSSCALVTANIDSVPAVTYEVEEADGTVVVAEATTGVVTLATDDTYTYLGAEITVPDSFSAGVVIWDNQSTTVEVQIDVVSLPPTVGEIADAVCDELLTGHTTSGTLGERLGRIPNVAAGANGGLFLASTGLTTAAELDAAQDTQHALTRTRQTVALYAGIDGVTSQTVFELSDGPSDDDIYNGFDVLMVDANGFSEMRKVIDYDGFTKVLTIDSAPTGTVTTSWTVRILPSRQTTINTNVAALPTNDPLILHSDTVETKIDTVTFDMANGGSFALLRLTGHLVKVGSDYGTIASYDGDQRIVLDAQTTFSESDPVVIYNVIPPEAVRINMEASGTKLSTANTNAAAVQAKLPAGGRNMAGAGDTATNLDQVSAGGVAGDYNPERVGRDRIVRLNRASGAVSLREETLFINAGDGGLLAADFGVHLGPGGYLKQVSGVTLTNDNTETTPAWTATARGAWEPLGKFSLSGHVAGERQRVTLTVVDNDDRTLVGSFLVEII